MIAKERLEELTEDSEIIEKQEMMKKIKKEAIIMVKQAPPTFDAYECRVCKNLKYCYQKEDNHIEISCKKGDKSFLINGVFACGQFKPRRRK